MPVYRVNEVGAVGLIDRTDMRPYEIPKNAWSFANNARMYNRKAVSVPVGVQEVNLSDFDVHALDYYNSPTGEQHLYCYSDGKILSVDNNGVVRDVTGPGVSNFSYPDFLWITDQFAGVPLATNGVDSPQCWYNPGTPITPADLSQDLPSWTAGATCKLIRTYKNFIVALNIVDIDAFPTMVWWSDAAAPGLLPTTWDYAATDNLAGRTQLGMGTGVILGAETLRDSLYIYTEQATFRMDFVGGQFVMKFTQVFTNSGAFGPRCVAKMPNNHFVITQDDIIVHDGQQLRSVGDMRVRNRLHSGINDTDKNRVWCEPYLKYSEVWVGYPEAQVDSFGDKAINYAIVWQWDEGAWGVRDLKDSRHMRELPVLEAASVDDTWENGEDTDWDTGTDIIWNESVALGDLTPVITSTDGWIYRADQGVQEADTLLFIEDIDMSTEQEQETVTEVYPRVDGETVLEIRVGRSHTVEGGIIWDRWQVFDPTLNDHIRQRATGRRHAIQFRGKNFTLSGYDMVWVSAGRR